MFIDYLQLDNQWTCTHYNEIFWVLVYNAGEHHIRSEDPDHIQIWGLQILLSCFIYIQSIIYLQFHSLVLCFRQQLYANLTFPLAVWISQKQLEQKWKQTGNLLANKGTSAGISAMHNFSKTLMNMLKWRIEMFLHFVELECGYEFRKWRYPENLLCKGAKHGLPEVGWTWHHI